jgi:serine/threonine protein kinase
MTTPELQQLYPEWEHVRLLGEGAFGQVYEIKRGLYGDEEHAALKVIHIPQSAAEIKALRSEGADDASVSEHYAHMAQQLSNEIATQAKLKGNTNIVSYEDRKIVPDADGVGQTILIRMELLTPLLDYMSERPMSAAEVLRLGADMARALLLCERHKILHRDIKPQNIFVSPSGDFKLGDFGVAREMEKTTMNLSRKGTYNYMSPEVFHGRMANATADIYSLGVVLYTLLNGNRAPFLPPPPAALPSAAARETAQQQRLSGVALPPLVGVSPALNEVILKMCAFAPADRFQSASELVAALEGVAYELQSDKTVSLRALMGITPDVAPPADELTDEGNRWMDGTPFIKETPPAPEPLPAPEPIEIPAKPKGTKILALLAAAVTVLAVIAIAAVALALRKERPVTSVDGGTTQGTSAVVETSATTVVTTTAKPSTTTQKPTTAKPTTTTQKPTTAVQSYKVGSIVKFGKYDWKVLDVKNGQALLLSKYILEKRMYSESTAYVVSVKDDYWRDPGINWAESDLRQYLNSSFLNQFTSTEQAKIQTTRLKNEHTIGIGSFRDTSDTNDKVFLLSLSEVSQYLDGSDDYEKNIRQSFCAIDNSNNYKRTAYYLGTNQAGWWWVRSPTGGEDIVLSAISETGQIDTLGPVQDEVGGVRPAMWVKIEG